MSSDDFESSDAAGDFSASEDEWKPSKEITASSETESEVDNNIEKAEEAKINKSNIKQGKPTLRAKMFKKYKPVTNTSGKPKPLSSSLTQILETSTYKKRKKLSSSQNTEESDSSGDDYLVDPKTIDLKSSFFNVSPACNNSNEIPNFDCNAGMRLSDSDNDSDINEPTQGTSKSIPQTINFQKFHDYTINLEKAKNQIKNLKSEIKQDHDVNISELLALGEKSASSSNHKKQIKQIKSIEESDSDWEEVKDAEINNQQENRDNIEITVQLGDNDRREKKKSIDLEAQLKRKLNRVIKENQVYLHKVCLLCHIAHGIYCNKVLNDPKLMNGALRLLPNKDCYPSGPVSIKYLESLSKWFKTVISLKSEEMYCYLKKRPTLPISLALQIKTKTAICKKDFVLIFIILLRAMRIHCRMVMNLQPPPLRPNKESLCTIKLKKDEPETAGKRKNVQMQENQAKKKHCKTNTELLHNTANIVEKKAESKKTVEQSQKLQKKSGNKNSSPQIQKAIENRPKRIQKKVETSDQIEGNTNTARLRKTITITKNFIENNSQKNRSKSKIQLTIEHPKKSKLNENDNLTSDLHPLKNQKETFKTKKKIGVSKNSKTLPDKSEEIIVSTHFLQIDSNMSTNNTNKLSSNGVSTRITRSKRAIVNSLTVPQLDGSDDFMEKKKSATKSNKRSANLKTLKIGEEFSDPDLDKDSIPLAKIRNKSLLNNVKRLDRRVLSTDFEDEEAKVIKKKIDLWVEVYSEAEEKWVTINLFKSKVDCVNDIKKALTQPVTYVIAWNDNNTIKDVTARYCPQFYTRARKIRVEQEWLDEAIYKYIGRRTKRDQMEDKELKKSQMEQPLPTTISEFKNHPLYVLTRHLLKFEAIYPPNAPTLGFIRNEPVYARECVHQLHSREIWYRQARVVKPREQPYKVVKSRPKWDRHTNQVIRDQPLEIFGYWQTMEYDPPTAENGIVPRNAYGNVELFKECMLPKGTVHLKYNGLNRICKKLKIDCALAVTGFDFHQGSCHPVFDGFIICKEFVDQVITAWNDEQEEAQKKEEEKYQQRVFGNWKKLIRGLLIREKLKVKYNFKSLKIDDRYEKDKKSKKQI